MMKFKIALFIFSGLMINLSAQEVILPHLPTPDEEKRMEKYIEEIKLHSQRSSPIAPPGEVRTMAEWEQIQALIITWAGHTTILREIVRNAVKECKVLIITTNPATVTNTLTSAGIPMDSVQFVNTPFNSIWVRDYGPWTVYKNDVDSLYLIDWIYNRPREEDDATPVAIAQHLDIPIFEATVDPDDFVHTGGNHLPDGMGTAFSSMLVLEENNDKTEDEIDSIARKYLGVKQYIKFPTLPFDGIHHLDMHMRVIDEETIIFGEYPDGVADGPQINANIEYLLDEFQTAFGNKYKIVRLPMPPESDRYPDNGGDYRTYTNSIFINKTILVPTYEEKYDTTALRIYRENLPGYNVVGINCNSIIPSLGALHCITKLVGVNDPLMIAHAKLRDSDEAEKDYPLSAIIKHRSGILEANTFFRIAGDSVYTGISMSLSDSLQNIWSAVIPAHAAGIEIQYYIHAVSNNGKEQVRPIVAPVGYFKFRIQGEPANQPPVVNIIYPAEGAIFSIDEGFINIEMAADDIDGEIAKLVVKINGAILITLDSLPYEYNWIFPGEGDFEIIVHATDDKGSESLSEVIQVTVESTTAIDPLQNSTLQVFPNPVRDVVWIQNSMKAINDISILNMFGQSKQVVSIRDGDKIGYDFTMFPSGVYFLTGMLENEVVGSRVIKL